MIYYEQTHCSSMEFSISCILAKSDTSLDECFVSQPTYPKEDFPYSERRGTTMNYINLVCIFFLRLSRIASVLCVVACSCCDVSIFPSGYVVSSSGGILSLQLVLCQAKPMRRTCRNEQLSGTPGAAFGDVPCAVPCFRSLYLQSSMLNIPDKMKVDDQATKGDGEFGGGLCMLCVPSTCTVPPTINFQLGPFLSS